MKTKKSFLLLIALSVMMGCGRTTKPKEVVRPYESYTQDELQPTFDPPEQPDVDTPPAPTATPSLPPIEVIEPQPQEGPTATPTATPLPLPSPTPPKVNPPKFKVNKDSVTQFQILVFPHVGDYTTPQQRESVTSRVIVRSSKPCVRYLAQLNTNQEWEKSGAPLEENKEFLIQISDARFDQEANYFECSAGFSVKREGLIEYQYPGNVVALPKKGSIHLVNLVEPETYLKGVVPSEVYSFWPATVLKVQAIAARTYAWWSVIRARNLGINHYDMDDTVQFQAYTGTTVIRATTNQAVDDTRGVVIRDANGEIIKAYFSADSGGHTADSIDVFNEQRSYCKAKPETFDIAKLNSWKKDPVSMADLTLKLKNVLPAGKSLQNISVNTKDRSGRVATVMLLLEDGKKLSLNAVTLARALQLQSRLFEIQPIGDATVVFSGRGNGHGVGMSQEGAFQYVKQLGWTYEQILQFYYTGVTLSQ